MRIFYYFLKNLVTDETVTMAVDDYMGEPNDLVLLEKDDCFWVIIDYAVEYEGIDEPEDY